ncbi:hypothetical protein C4577_07795 [Candidatus Parcubacteria bacterium]|nr:MAG: hypothetical protein C4577_07795 [Candidatus Parcubacteria bacterium]
MIFVKKSLFAILFLAFLIPALTSFAYVLKDFYVIFGLDGAIWVKQVLGVLFLLLSVTFFVVFCVLARDWVYVLFFALASFFLPLLIVNDISFFVLGVGLVLVVVFGYLNVDKKMVSCVDFKPGRILVPSIVQITTSLLLVLSLALYFPVDLKIKEKGFVLPDAIIDASVGIIGQNGASSPVSLTPAQIAQLKENPDLLQQSGLADLGLDFSSLEGSMETVVKTQVKKQIEGIVAPFTGFIPVLVSVLFFLSLRFLVSILSFLLYPFIWLIFLILEKSGLVSYETEMKEVRKIKI